MSYHCCSSYYVTWLLNYKLNHHILLNCLGSRGVFHDAGTKREVLLIWSCKCSLGVPLGVVALELWDGCYNNWLIPGHMIVLGEKELAGATDPAAVIEVMAVAELPAVAENSVTGNKWLKVVPNHFYWNIAEKYESRLPKIAFSLQKWKHCNSTQNTSQNSFTLDLQVNPKPS